MALWNEEQMQELDQARKQHPVPHVRCKALALWNLGRGKNQTEVADFFGVFRHAVLSWTRRYQQHGLAGLEVEEGRGRPSRVDEAEVRRAIEQTPRNYGIAQERWTLESLRQAVPSLRQFQSLRSIGYVLARMGMAPKRGQYRRCSPDPDYQKKKNTRRPVSDKPSKTRRK